jgi:hypothetical protein
MKWLIGFGVWLVLVVGAASYTWLSEKSYVGGGFVAKEVCSCIHVGGRDFDACRADLMALPGIERLDTAPLPDGEGVRSGLPGFSPRVARAQPGRGCTLEP